MLVSLVDGNGRVLDEQASELRIKPQVALAPTEKVPSVPAAPPPAKDGVPSGSERAVVAVPDKVAGRDTTQVQTQPRLSVTPVVEVESPGQADCRISVGQAESLPVGAYVFIRGVPTAAVLSAGRPWWEKSADQADE